METQGMKFKRDSQYARVVHQTWINKKDIQRLKFNSGGGGGGSVNSVNPGTGITITGTATDPIINSTIYTLTEVLTAGTTVNTGATSLTLDPFNNNIYMQMYDISNSNYSRFNLQPNKIELFHQFWDNDTPLNPGRGQADLLMENGSLRFSQSGKGINQTSFTYVEFNEPNSGDNTIKFPAPTVPDASYNLAIQVTDGVTTVDADVEGVLNISSLLISSPTTTLGDIIFNGGAGDVRYGIGTVGQVLKSDGSVPQWETLTEEQIDGTTVYDPSLTGGVVIDLATHTDAYYILTGAVTTTISVTNVPAVGLSFVRTWTIKSTTTEALILPVTWVVIGTYVADGSENYLTIRFSNFTTVGAKVICYITQA
jgi:hypothetical protein